MNDTYNKEIQIDYMQSYHITKHAKCDHSNYCDIHKVYAYSSELNHVKHLLSINKRIFARVRILTRSQAVARMADRTAS